MAAVDLATKALVRICLPPDAGINLPGRLLTFAHYANPGKVLGLFDDYFSIFFVLGIIILAYLLIMHIFARPSRWLVGAECFIFGGALGNAFDKLGDGNVTDFITINLPPFWNFAFNLADVFIIAGAFVTLPLGLVETFYKPAAEVEETARPE